MMVIASLNAAFLEPSIDKQFLKLKSGAKNCHWLILEQHMEITTPGEGVFLQLSPTEPTG